jgi:hypothetical protein
MGSQIIHLKYDVVRAQGTRVLDEMEEVHEVNCTSNSLSIEIIPESDFDIASRQFQLGNVIAGGKEWGCQSGELGAPAAAAAFTRRVESVLIEHPSRIVLITSDCTPFEAFESQDIDIWSEDVVHSGNDLRSYKSALTDPAEMSEGNLSKRYYFETDLVNQDQQWTGTKVLSNEYFLLGGVSGTSGCRCRDFSKMSGSTTAPAAVKACQDKGCTWIAGNLYGGTCSGVCTQVSITGSVSLLYEVSIQANFRFRIRAGTNQWGSLILKELETWVDETLTCTSKIKASVNAFFSVSRADTLVQKQRLIGLPTSFAGIGADLGLYGELKVKMEANIEGQFNAEAGIISSRRKKYGGWWDTSQPGYITSGTIVPINEDFPPTKDKYFTWGGKVVAKVQASLELKTSLMIGLSAGSFGSLGLELSSGLGLGLIAEFKYALGNIILQPVVTSRFFIKENDAICQQTHQTEAQLKAVMTALDTVLSVNPFYDGTLRPATTLLDSPLFIGCWASGGVAGQTQDYERIDGGSSNTFQQVESNYVDPAPAPTPKAACIFGIDCPVQPGACANGYAGTAIGHPCASGCAIGFGYDQQCQPSTCCRANAASPPANGEHKIVGEGSWTNQALTVPGGKYTEVRCNAGYTLSGRNLGFQLLGTWPNCAGSCTSSCCYSLATNYNQRPWDWPKDSSYTACTNSGQAGSLNLCSIRRSIPADGSWKLEERSCNPISCGVYPAPAYGTVSLTTARAYGQTVTITCNTGYELTGDARASATPLCQANGQFTTGKQCARKVCAPFSAIPNGAAFPDTSVLSGQRAVVSCYKGYELTGDVSLLCDRGAYQITTFPLCSQISCGLLSVHNGLAALKTPILFGNKTEIHCNAGFTFSSQTMTAECTDSGASVWAVCNPVNCLAYFVIRSRWSWEL